MTEEGHNIDPWFIPDDEEILLGEPRGEAEEEHYEENGELLDDEEPEVCPHCGKPYKSADGGTYIHNYVRKDVGGRLETREVWKPAVLCVPNGEKRYHHDFRNKDPADIR